MSRFLWISLLLFCGCPNSLTQAQTEFCDTPFGIGPDGTGGICNLGAVCTPSNLVTCNANNCCHIFCELAGCGPNIACVTLTPDQIPAGGPSDLGGNPDCACLDGGPAADCVCSDGGARCFRTSCLGLCAE